MNGERLNGTLISRYLETSGERPEQLCARLDISMALLQKMRRGNLPKRMTVVRELAQLIGISMDKMLVPDKPNRDIA